MVLGVQRIRNTNQGLHLLVHPIPPMFPLWYQHTFHRTIFDICRTWPICCLGCCFSFASLPVTDRANAPLFLRFFDFRLFCFFALFFALLSSSFHNWMRQWRNVNKKKLVDKNCMGVDRTEQIYMGDEMSQQHSWQKWWKPIELTEVEVERTEGWLHHQINFLWKLFAHFSLICRTPGQVR